MTTHKTTTRWPAFIIVLVAAFTAFSWWSLDRAASKVSAVSDPDYYTHGLKYHSPSLDTQTAATTGWTVTPLLEAQTLTITVRDSTNIGIADCQAVLNFPAGQGDKETIGPLTMTQVGKGTYSGKLPPGLPPSVSVTLTLTKDQATTQRQILINQGN